MMLLKCCTQYVSKFGKLSSGHRTGKGPLSLQSQSKAMPKNVQTTTQLLISHASKVILKILQARLQQQVNQELPDVKAGLRKDRKNRDQLTNISCITETREFQKKKKVCSLITLKPLIVWITTNCGKFSMRWAYQITLPAYWETCMQLKSNS